MHRRGMAQHSAADNSTSASQTHAATMNVMMVASTGHGHSYGLSTEVLVCVEAPL
jgi:hypothetical protein